MTVGINPREFYQESLKRVDLVVAIEGINSLEYARMFVDGWIDHLILHGSSYNHAACYVCEYIFYILHLHDTDQHTQNLRVWYQEIFDDIGLLFTQNPFWSIYGIFDTGQDISEYNLRLVG